jgi:hypothetical protein
VAAGVFQASKECRSLDPQGNLTEKIIWAATEKLEEVFDGWNIESG